MDSPSLISRSFEVAKIDANGEEKDIHVFGVRVSRVLMLRSMSEDIASAIMGIMSGNATSLAGETVERIVDKETNEVTGIKNISNAVSLPMFDRLSDTKRKGVESITKSLLDPKNMAVVADLIADSCRDDDWLSGPVIIEGSLDNFVSLVTALVAANKETFSPFLQLLRKVEAPQELVAV